jgi:hypothetical protein
MNYADHLPNGWAKIAQQLQERLEPFVAAGGRVLQVKEKFGGLRVYTVGHDVPDLDDLYEAAEQTCVECGAPGTMSTRHGWVSPRCEEHT